MKRLARLIGITAILTLFPTLAFAVSYTWTGSGDGVSWSDQDNWDQGSGYPDTVADTAIINTAVGVAMNVAVTIGDLQLSGGSNLTLFQAFAVSGPVSIAAGCSLDLNGMSFTFSGVMTNSGTLQLLGSESITGTIDASNGTVLYYGSGDYSSLSLAAGSAYNNLTFNNSSGIWKLGFPLTVNGSLQISSGTLNGNSQAIILKRSWSCAGAYTPGVAAVSFTGASGIQAVTSGGQSFSGFTVNTTGSTVQLQDPLVATGAVSLTAGTFDPNGQAMTVGGDWTNGAITLASAPVATFDGSSLQTVTSNGRSFAAFTVTSANTARLADALTTTGNVSVTAGTFDANSKAITVGGNWANTGTFSNSGLVTFHKAGGTQTVNAGVSSFLNVTKDNTGILQVIASNLTVTGTLSIASGLETVDGNGRSLTIGTLDNNGSLQLIGNEPSVVITTMDTNSGAVVFTGGAGPYSLPAGIGNAYYNLVINGAATFQLSAATTTVNGALTLTAGTLSTNGKNLNVTGAVSGAGTLTATAGETIQVGGNFAPTAFTTASSTVTFNTGTATSVGGYTFNNLTINKNAAGVVVTSTAGLTVNGTLTLTEGTWSCGSYTHSVAGAWDSSSANFTLSAGTSNIQLTSATPNITTKAADSFYNLTVGNGGTLQGAT
ncbi:MAG: hypothetical protein ABSF77_14650, partial [Spirochaetia bacterium]